MAASSSPSVIVVGAGPGLGVAVASRFALEGYVPGLIARHDATLERSSALVHSATGRTPATATGDAGAPDSLAQAWEALVDQIGPPEVAVFNAMQNPPGAPTTLDPAAVTAALGVNVTGALVTAQLATTAMRARGAGTLLFTGGGLALQPFPAAAALAAGKAGLRNLVSSLALELAPEGIHVATVTVCGRVSPGTAFDPDVIASVYWDLHCEPADRWTTERIFD